MQKKNIVLIGMPGVGKSTIGVIAAKQLGYQFVDADLLIQQPIGQVLGSIRVWKFRAVKNGGAALMIQREP